MDIRSTQFTRVAFIGAIANPNVGDEAILEENIRLVDTMYGMDKMVYVFSKDPSYTALTSLGDVIPVNYIYRLTLRCNFEIDRVRALCEEVLSYTPGSGDDADFEAIHQILSNIDVLHIVGGGYLNSFWPEMTEEVRVAALLAHRYGARVIATGIGIYPMSDDTLGRLADIIDVCEFVDFRDGSMDQLSEELRARYADKLLSTTDDAVAFGRLAPERWLARIPRVVKTASMGSYLNVSLHPKDAIRESGALDGVLKLADHLYAKGIIDRVNFLEFYPGDFKLFGDLAEEGMGIACPTTMLKLWRYPAFATQYVVAHACANVGSRYHQAVFSLAAGVPVLSLSIDNYYTYKLQAIHSQVGSESVLPVSDVTWEQLLAFADSLEEIRGSLTHAASDYDALRTRKVEMVAKAYSGNAEGTEVLLDRATDANPVKISVVVPVFNGECTLRECLDSVLSQTLKEIEVLCVDDGSTDASSAILSEYGLRDNRVKVINQAHAGTSSARNAGMRAASGEFVAFVEQKDWLASDNALKTLYWAAKNHGTLAACGGYTEVVVGEDGSREAPRQVVTTWDENNSGLEMPRDGLVSYRDFQFDYGMNRFIYDRQLLVSNELWFPAEDRYGDPLWFVRAMDAICEFWATTIPVYCHRTDRTTPTMPNDQVVALVDGVIEMLGFASERGYDRLQSLTYSRITHDLAPFMATALCAEPPDPAVEEAMARLQAAVSEGGGIGNLERIIIRNGEREAVKRMVAAADSDAERARRELAVVTRELEAAKREFEAARSGFNVEMENEIARIKSSRTWKVGSVVWWLPRKIRDLTESH